MGDRPSWWTSESHRQSRRIAEATVRAAIAHPNEWVNPFAPSLQSAARFCTIAAEARLALDEVYPALEDQLSWMEIFQRDTGLLQVRYPRGGDFKPILLQNSTSNREDLIEVLRNK